MLRSLFILWPLLLLAGCAPPRGSSARSADFTFRTDEGYVFDARVHLPPPKQRNGYGVLLMGGGLGNDLNWTVPGSLRIGDHMQQVTISGEPHEDAPRIADSLVQRGYVVAHWGTIRRDDPKRDKWPYEATTYPIPVMIEHARAALRAFRNRRLFDENKTVLLGYSLGGHRAVVIASTDRGLAGLVLLAPAQFTRTGLDDGGRNVHREQVERLMSAIDLDGDGECSRDEFAAWSPTASPADVLGAMRFDDLDFDDDRGLVAWEISAALARLSRRDMSIPEDLPTDRHGLRWPEDILAEHRISTLILYGELDNAQAHHAPIIADLIEDRGLAHVDLRIIPGVGHTLGSEFGGRVGPIDHLVLETIGTWLDEAVDLHDARNRD